jgi:hypothetical protein
MTQDTVTLEVVILLPILLEQNVSQHLFLTDKYHENLIFAQLVSKFPTIHGARSSSSCSKKAAIDPFLKQLNLVRALTPYFFRNHFNINFSSF